MCEKLISYNNLQTQQHQVSIFGAGQRQWDCGAQSSRASTTGAGIECHAGVDTECQWAVRGDCTSG